MIARMLTSESVPKPSIYKKMNYSYPYNDKTKKIWDESSILDILKNPNYTGNLYQNRRRKLNYKSKKIVNVPKKDWIVSYNTHEPIIDMKTYELVQNIHEKNKLIHKKGKERQLLLQGFMKCKECGYTIGINTSSDKTRNYTICNHYRKYPKQKFCTIHSMRYEVIEETVLNNVKVMCEEYIDTKKLETILKNSNKKNNALDKINTRILQAKKVISDNTTHIHNSYMDKLNGIITLKMYQDIANNLSKEISINQQLIEKLEYERQSLADNKSYNDEQCKLIVKEYLSSAIPSRTLLANIIDKITIDENKNVEIYYKIKPNYR